MKEWIIYSKEDEAFVSCLKTKMVYLQVFGKKESGAVVKALDGFSSRA